MRDVDILGLIGKKLYSYPVHIFKSLRRIKIFQHVRYSSALLLLYVLILSSQQQLSFKHITTIHGLSQNSVTCILQDRRGYMWFGTREGLNRYDGFSFMTIKYLPTDSQSLSNNTVTTLCEDQEGYLWVGTGDGLNRIHPITGKVKRYYLDEVGDRTANEIISLFVDSLAFLNNKKEKILWVGTLGNGLFRFVVNGEQFRYEHFRLSQNDRQSLGGNSIGAIFRDGYGTLWVGANQNVLNQFLPSTNSFLRHVIDTNFTLGCVVTGLFTDSRKKIWAAIANRGLYQITMERNEKNSEHIRLQFIPIHTDTPGTSKPLLSPSSIAEDHYGNMWVSYLFYGVDRYEQNNDGTYTITHFKHDNTDMSSISSDQIGSLFVDKNNILWAGDRGYGINKARLQERFTLYQNNPYDTNSLRSKSIRGIYEVSDGTLLVGGYSEVMRFDRKRGVMPIYYHNNNFSVSSSNSIVYAYCFVPDPILHDSITWIGTERFGLIRLKNSDNTFDVFLPNPKDSNSLINPYIHALYPDDNGILWIGTQAGLQSLEVENYKRPKFISYKHEGLNPNGRNPKIINCIYKSSQGILWVATNDAGIHGLFPNKPDDFLHFVHNSADATSLASNDVKTIYEDKEGRMWFGTAGGGLNLLLPDGKSFRRYDERDGLPNNVVYGILGDSVGHLWLSTNKGISRFTPSTNEFWNFTESDGLQDNEFNTGSYYMCKHGEMFFGGINGFNAFFPEKIERNTYLPPAHITSMKIFDKEISPERLLTSPTLSLAYDEDVLTFEFIALDYTAPERNLYKYKMEGNDADWVQTGNRRYVTYAHLSPGEYIFQVKGTNNDGVWNEHPATVSFVIHPPFWATWWFRAIGILLFLSVGPFIYYRRVRQLKKLHQLQREFSKQLLESQEQERKRIAAELHDSIGQNMLVMKNKSGLGKETTDSEKKQKFFDDISDIVLKTVKELQTISYNLRPYELDRIGLTEAINAIFVTVKDTETFALRTSVESIDTLFPKETEIHIYRIVQEGMNNILKHARASEVMFTIKKKERSVLLLIQDNGVGFDVSRYQQTASKVHGFGLSGLKERVHLLGGTIEFQSEIRSGTTVRIEFPIRLNEQNKSNYE